MILIKSGTVVRAFHQIGIKRQGKHLRQGHKEMEPAMSQSEWSNNHSLQRPKQAILNEYFQFFNQTCIYSPGENEDV